MRDLLKKLKDAVIGNTRDLTDSSTFSRISLIVFLAWVGLGADALSSSCYGPEEIYKTLGAHINLSIIVGLLTTATIFIISTSYSQIIRLFPHGGGGYLVASRLISPQMGMVSGCALLIDYVLTISISISSGSDAVFSFLPIQYHAYKTVFALTILAVLVILNLRGVKESVKALTPIFIVFVFTHILLIGFSFSTHIPDIKNVAVQTGAEFSNTVHQLGFYGTFFLIMKAYSMGAGTYTGIEAVSNGIPNLREPRVKTAIKTMRLLAFSLSVAVLGLIVSFFLFNIHLQPGKTINAILITSAIDTWNPVIGQAFLYITLISEAALLFVAAQTGFLDGPRVMANMAHDSWLPHRFTMLSDRLVSRNGVLIMGIAAFAVIWLSKASVAFLVVLYSINVFITFSLSQYGMVKHWFTERKTEKKWLEKLLINGIGLLLTVFILLNVIVVKFYEGGWITMIITGALVTGGFYIKRHYRLIGLELSKIHHILISQTPEIVSSLKHKLNCSSNENRTIGTGDMTAVILVNGYSGIGLYSLFTILNSFQNVYKNFVFIQVGIVDSDSFHKSHVVDKIRQNIEQDLNKYTSLIREMGYHAEYHYCIGTNVAEEVIKMVPEIVKKYPNATFVGGQLVFKGTYQITRILHNYTIFSIQKHLYNLGITTIIIPISLNKVQEISRYK
ncbi:APC family permease [Parabacteroides sp. FAFU027]|uniref:APC family permease n=1 Tax=Parabacteroides sp. FAFU027 TaxID=2922715 RepID=UPI001FAF5600|nr:APC family permease [Parabacteroides sp. FAFU027]